MIFLSKNKTASETRWGVAKNVDTLVVGIFDFALTVYLCINTKISFVFHDSVLYLRLLLELGATFDMRISDGVGVP